MSADEIQPHFGALRTALARFAAALEQPKTEWTRDAAIQRFEFCFELAWKAVARAARREGVECGSPRGAVRVARRLGWIADDTAWLDMLADRNRASHTYNEQTAEEIFARLAQYRDLLEQLAHVLQHTVVS